MYTYNTFKEVSLSTTTTSSPTPVMRSVSSSRYLSTPERSISTLKRTKSVLYQKKLMKGLEDTGKDVIAFGTHLIKIKSIKQLQNIKIQNKKY